MLADWKIKMVMQKEKQEEGGNNKSTNKKPVRKKQNTLHGLLREVIAVAQEKLKFVKREKCRIKSETRMQN